MNEETTMKPNTYYSSLANLETYYVNQHGVLFLIDSPDFHKPERLDALPADAREEAAMAVQLCDINLHEWIEEVTA